QTGQPLDLVPLPGTSVAFLLLRQLGAQHAQDTYSIYRTSDGGADWTQAFTGLPSFNGIAIGTTRATRGGPDLWAWDDTALYRSVAGAAFAAVPGVTGTVRTVDLS